MKFKPRLYSIPDEKSLFKYFKKNLRYLKDDNVYTIAGIFHKNENVLYEELLIAWKEDKEFHKQELVTETLNILNENYIPVHHLIQKGLNDDGIGYK